MCSNRRQRGMTLIELIFFIIIVGVALAGVLTVLNVTARSSADPMIRKQMLAVAEAILEEVQLQPFTWCDPDDATAATATSAVIGVGGCTLTAEAAGPELSEVRTGAPPFDNVNDYAGLALASPIASITGSALAPAGLSATVAVVPEALNGVGDASATSASLRITVTVTVTRGTETIALDGYRTRHSPNALP